MGGLISGEDGEFGGSEIIMSFFKFSANVTSDGCPSGCGADSDPAGLRLVWFISSVAIGCGPVIVFGCYLG